MAFALAVVACWVLGFDAALRLLPGEAPPKANAALALAALGLGLALAARDRRSAGVAAAAAAALAVATLTLVEYAGGVDLGIDEVLADDLDPGAPAPGRMSPLTAAAVVLLALGLLAARRASRRAAAAREALAASGGFIALVALSAHAYGATLLGDVAQVALPTAGTLLALAVGAVLLGGDGPLGRMLTDPGATGQVARRLLPAAVLVPLLVGFVRIEMQRNGLVDTSQGATLYAMAMLLALTSGALLILRRLHASQQERDQAEARRAEAARRLAEVVRRTELAETVTGHGTWEWDVRSGEATWSKGMYRLFGVDPATFRNSDDAFLALVHPDDRARLAQSMAAAVANPGRFLQEYRLARPDGRLIHVRGEGNVVLGADGRPAHLLGFVQDVTELRALEETRRAAEQAVQESERRLRTFFEANPAGILITRPDGTVVDVNAAAERLWGRSRADFLAPGFRMAQLYADPGERAKVVERVQKGAGARDLELRMRHGDGTLRTMLFNVEVIDLAGAPAFLASGQDITALRDAEQRVRESESRLRAILENATDAIVTGDASGTIVGWNRAAERIFGHGEPEAIGQPIAMLMPADQWQEYQQDIADFLDGRPSRFVGRAREMRALRKDGRTLDVELALGVWQGPAGPMFTGIVRDISQRKAAEAAVRRAQERFQTVFELSPVAICLTKEDGRFVDANAAFCQLVAHERADLLAGRVLAPEVWEDPQERQRMLIAIRERGLVRDLELRVRRPDGEVRTTLASLEFVDLGGGTTILAILQDITERQRTQAEREARIASEAELERLRRTDRFKSDFINSTAHELATPLTPIVLNVRTLASDKTLGDTQRRIVESLERSVSRLRSVVDNMVGAADVQARTIALDRRRLNLTRELRAAVAAHHAAAERAGLALEDPPDSGITVSADPTRLQLVLGHLLGNTSKFTPAGGRITVASRRFGDEARVEVTDTGLGLTRKQMEGLWKPFAQAHDKSQRTDSGSGLGLYIVKGIVDMHGGEVGVRSDGPGKGSTFWFSLPLATGHVDPLAKPARDEPAPEPRRDLNPGAHPPKPSAE